MRFSLLFLSLALLPAVGWGAEPNACQPGYFARLVQHYLPRRADPALGTRSAAQSVRRAVENKFDVRSFDGRSFHEGWIDWKELGEPQRALLDSLPELSATERAELIPLVRSVRPENVPARRYRQLILLGLYDRGAWGSLSSAVVEGNLHSHLALSYLPALLKKLPSELREEYLHSLGDKYFMLSKEKNVHYAEFAPKRMADLYFKHLLRGDELIEAELSRGASPRDAFRAYVAKVQRYIAADDLYSADQALKMIEKVREALRDSQARGLVSGGGEEPVLWVGGSLPNGRATFLESDIDIGTSVVLPESVRAEIEQSVKSYVESVRPGSGIHASFKPDLDAKFWTKKHPVAFRVRAGGIDLIVAKPAGEMRIYPLH